MEAIKVGMDMFKSALDLAKGAKDLLPAGEKKTAVEKALDGAAKQMAIADAQIAQSLGYRLCTCTYPPQIMTKVKVAWGNESRCPTCGDTTDYNKPLNIAPTAAYF